MKTTIISSHSGIVGKGVIRRIELEVMMGVTRWYRVVALFAGLWLLTSSLALARPASGASLQRELAALNANPVMLVDGERLQALADVSRFYAERDYKLAWSDESRALALVSAIAKAYTEGLNPADYHLAAIHRHMIEKKVTPKSAMQLDLLLSDAYLSFARDLSVGRVRPKRLFPDWNIHANTIDVVARLQQALADGKIDDSLAMLAPTGADYRRLRQALARYHGIEAMGGWPTIPTGSKLELGTSSPRVELLRQRLQISGDLPTVELKGKVHRGAADIFDIDLVHAVQHFQHRMGIEGDGIVGRRTLAALNVPVGERIRQIVINMERLRWLPRRLGTRYIEINIPAFSLTAVNQGGVVLSMRTIVGKEEPDKFTPVFMAGLSYLVFNPAWYIPKNIAVRDILPRLRRNPGLLANLHIQVLERRGNALRVIDAAGIDWASLDSQNFPYRLRQNPGPHNDLGTIKFISPNPYDVYLHDTPYKNLFTARMRDLSHGCVRVEHPVKLAAFVLHGDSEWSKVRIKEAIDSGKRRVVHLSQSLPIYFLYLTAWADTAGVNFRNDIYKRDQRLYAALQ